MTTGSNTSNPTHRIVSRGPGWFRLGLAAAVVTMSWLLVRPPEASGWLKLSAQPVAVMGGGLRLRADVAPVPGPQHLVIDLHWSTTRREPRGFLSGGPDLAVPTAGGTYEVDLPVPARPELGYVHAIAFLGPSARWADRVRSASSDPIRVVGVGKDAGAAVVRDPLVELAVQDQRPDPGSAPSPVFWVRWLLGGLWVLGAGLAVGRGSWGSQPGTRRGGTGSVGRWVLVGGCLLAAAWEMSGVEDGLGDAGRRLAVAHRWYDERVGLQKVLTVAVLLGLGLAADWRLRRVTGVGARSAWMGLGLFAALVLVGGLSLHATDRWANVMCQGVPAIQWLKLGAVLVTLQGLWRSGRARGRSAG